MPRANYKTPNEMRNDTILTLEGAEGFRVFESTSATNGVPLLVPGQSMTNSLPSNGFVCIHAPVSDYGTATLTLSFQGTGDTSNFTASASIKATAMDGVLQPITTETVPSPGTALVNPAVTALGGLGRYCFDLLPMSIPDSDIEWSIAEGVGNVIFNAGANNNKGRAVTVRGNAVGSFKLQVDKIAGQVPSPKPYIRGRVETNTMTDLHFYVLCDANGHPVVSTNWIDIRVANANHNGRQVAMSFRRASVNYITNNPAWFIPANDNVVKSMFAHTNNVGGLEVYCVHSFFDGSFGKTSHNIPAMPSDGIAIAAHAPLITLIHEILHACGLPDIFITGLDNTLVSEDFVGSQNWSGGTGTGYYPSDLMHSTLITRLLMYGYQKSGDADIPLGDVRAWEKEDNPQQGQKPPWHPTGVNWINRSPQH